MSDALLNKTRLQEIVRLGLHKQFIEDTFNTYAEKAAKEFNLPIGAVSIILDSTQHFIGKHGMEDWIDEVSGTPAEWSFCQNSVASKEPFIVENALTNEIMKDSPLVTEEGLRCYAGVPLLTKNNEVLGNFCVKGKESRQFSQEEIEKLKTYSSEIVAILEERVA